LAASIEVQSIRALDGSSTVKAFIDIRVGGVLIRGAKIIQQPGQAAWCGMPGVKTEHGGWVDVVALSPSLRERVNEVAVAAWQAMPGDQL
jgi:DNA-binding cell septation regulator SpoVG